MNVAKNPARCPNHARLPRPLSPTRDHHGSQVTSHKSRRPHLHKSPVTTSHESPATSHAFSCVCPLLNSLASLFRARVLCFQSFADSFTKTPGWGCLAYNSVYRSGSVSLCLSGKHLFSDLRPSRAKTQKSPSPSPLFVTLTHSLSRKSFPCHSYANTRDGGYHSPHFLFPIRNRGLFSCTYELLVQPFNSKRTRA